MFQYPQYADLVGSTYKSMFGPFIAEKSHREAFDSMIDAKVKLNKDLYEASKLWVESMNKVTQSFTTK